jgi:hypothetical protein
MRTRLVFATLAFSLAGFAGCASDLEPGPEGDDDVVEPVLQDGDDAVFAADGKADTLASTATYYQINRDMRKCAWPDCGGWWIHRVNRSWTQCNDGAWRDQCYVVDVDHRALGLSEEEIGALEQSMQAERVVVRGRLQNKIYAGKRRGQLRATEAWRASTSAAPSGTFYRVTARPIYCITSPCPNLHEAMLNSTESAEIHALGLETLGESIVAATYQALSDGPVLVAGTNATFVGHLGASPGTRLDASQTYTRVVSEGLVGTTLAARDVQGKSFSDPTEGRPPFPRTYRFDTATRTVWVDDAVAPCPAGAACFWSGIVTREATYTIDQDRVRLRFTTTAAESETYGIRYFPELAAKRDRERNLVLVELQDDGQQTDRRYRAASAAE